MGRLSVRPGARGTVGVRGRPLLPFNALFRQRARLVSPRPARTTVRRHGNVHPFPVGVASRLGLRGRLTRDRLALSRKPWPSGVGVSRPHCRYSCLHFRFPRLHRPSRDGFDAAGTLPYRSAIAGLSRRFGGALHARSSSVRGRSTSELLRTL